jgi:sulfide:quinone oxidoreductase
MRGGPMFELLFGLDTLLRQQGKRERIELTFFNAAAEPGKRLGEKAVTGLLAEMAQASHRHPPGPQAPGLLGQGRGHRGRPRQRRPDPVHARPHRPGLGAGCRPGALPGGFFKADEFCRVTGADKVFVAGDAGSYPGPDWMPKQAHMADLQAKAAAENLLLALDGKAPTARFKIELICIVDTLDKGILVYRDLKRGFLLPPSRLMHWAKRYFEGHYLKVFRR